MTNARLKVLSGKQEGSEIPLLEGKFLIGREEDCHLRPNSELVSRHHCVFAKDEYALRLRDLGSTNGTFVNGERLKGGVVLNAGDRVSVGQLEFEVIIGETVDSDSPEAPEVGDETLGDTSTVNAVDTATEIPAAPDQQPASASGDTMYMPQVVPGQVPSQSGAMAPPGYPMQYPMYGYPAYPQAYPGYYPQQMPFPQQPGYPAPQAEPGAAVEEAAADDPDAVPEVRLPDPATTGARPPEPKPEGDAAKSSDSDVENVPETAEKIIRQYLQRRPTTD